MARSVAAHREAVQELLSGLGSPHSTEVVPLMAALGRVLAVDVVAPLSLPPFANSQMDGFAVRAADLVFNSDNDGGAELAVVDPVPAGAAPAKLLPGSAAPIMTGAMMPEGADAVVPIEQAVPDVFPLPGVAATVRLPATDPGTFVRDAGSDISAGTVALRSGTTLGPGQLGLLAALGLGSVEVRTPLRVLLVPTGDEVVEPGEALPPGKIYDSNGTLLEAAMAQAGLHVTRAGVSGDDPSALLDLLRSHTGGVDLVVSTGGVSKGAYEVVRQAMDSQPVEFVSVAMQPGGPQGIGTFDDVPFLGFPGNPVSCLVSFEMFLRPALTALLGSPAARITLRAPLAEHLTSPAGKHQVRRGTVLPDGTVRLEGGPGSHLIHALANSNALVQVPEDVTELEAGAEVEVWML
ncbi:MULTISPECIES: gephyrin-like molybdotransferase Glp [Arthrobacter]|uniref:Molybdopterin molybdenumtransferase n=1 Tax=Arthrobacter terricola TaxID=2547396 RepID=A0A4V2ZUL4_9MICC|nr:MULTISPECIES: gephyrin-like molybdotransferase Glp [Arthrobacter]MBT8160172.1 molybdopterin molybdotransferase MoeA [Arthrobacter sp. GN70]TDG01165.1 molybdopterin molybdotransferase MoeA [Arthrobacter terricola]